MDLSISYIYGEAWTLAKKNILPFLVYSLIVGAIGIALVACIMPSGFWSTYFDVLQGNTHAAERLNQMQSFNPLQLLQYLVSAILIVPFYNAVVGVCRGTRNFTFDCVKLPAAVYVKFVVAYLLYILIVIVGVIFFIVPGVYLGIRLSQAGYYLIEHREAGIGEAMKVSWAATRGHVLEIFGIVLVAIVAVLAVVIPCVILFVALAFLGPVGIAIGAIALLVAGFMLELVFYMANGMVYVSLLEK